MKKMKRVLAMLLATTVFMSLLSGCGNKADENKDDDKEVSSEADAEKDAEGEVEKEETPEKLTVWVPDHARIDDWETSPMTVWMEEQLGFDLEIMPLSSEDYNTKVNVAMTTGSIKELPDVVMFTKNPGDTMVWDWAQAEAILPLTDYYNNAELAVNINAAYERTGVDYSGQITSPDGNIYGVAFYNQSYGNEFPGKVWIYKPWLDQLGAKVPTTTEEFYELLKQVVATDLNGNGKKDEIGMIGTEMNGAYPDYLRYLMNPYVYTGDLQYRVVEDGKVSAAYTTEEWKEAVKYVKKFFDEGLILGESLTMSQDQYKTLMNTEDHCVFAICYQAPDMIDAASGRATDYLCIDNLTGPEGVNYSTYRPSVADIRMVVTANCEYPQAAFRLGDLMSGEFIGISQRWGANGVDWDYPEDADPEYVAKLVPSVEGFEMSMVAYSDGTFWGGTDVNNGSWRQTGPFVRQYGIANGWGVEADGDKYTEIFNAGATLYQTADHEPEEVIPKLIFTTDESEVIAEIEANLKSYVQESLGAFLKGAKDIDKDWDAYIAEIENIGLDTYLETVQTVYDRMYK